MTMSVTSTSAVTSPTRLRTDALPPSTTPSSAASSGLICKVQRALPLTSTSTLCIHELFDRR